MKKIDSLKQNVQEASVVENTLKMNMEQVICKSRKLSNNNSIICEMKLQNWNTDLERYNGQSGVYLQMELETSENLEND